MGDIVEGRNAVLERLRAGHAVREVLLARGLKPHETIEHICVLAAEHDVPVREISRTDLDRLSVRGAHQGVVARVDPFAYVDIEDIIRTTEGCDASLVIVLDHVVDPGNLGAVIRSAEALGAHGVVIPKARAASVGPAASKAAAGAAEHLPIARVSNLVRSLELLKDAGYWVAGASEDTGQTLWDAPMEGRIALVMGSEEAGLSRLVERTCDFLVGIPMSGRTSSLNVAQAATVLVYEWVRKTSP